MIRHPKEQDFYWYSPEGPTQSVTSCELTLWLLAPRESQVNQRQVLLEEGVYLWYFLPCLLTNFGSICSCLKSHNQFQYISSIEILL